MHKATDPKSAASANSAMWTVKGATAVGFEPTSPEGPLVFKTSALANSATLPNTFF